jgi:outer membrane protein OmpA-like peptidoglycan-associated protein
VLHYSYLASHQAQAGQARVSEVRARQDIARGESERNRVLLESRTREAEAARRETEGMQHQLAELQAKQTERGMVLTLGDVLFDTAAATLKPGAATVLDRVAGFLEENEGTKVMVEGHTDSRGSDQYNAQLSQRRAEAVADALAFRGIERGRVEAVGRGESLPVASNDTAAGQQQNRRVELVFSDAEGRFASGSSATLR